MAGGRQAFNVYKAKKDGSGSNSGRNGGDNGSEVIRSKLLSQLPAIVYVQTRIDGNGPATLTDIFDLAFGQSESAARLLAALESEKNQAVDRVSEFESERAKLKLEVSSLYEKVNKLLGDKELGSAEVVAVGARTHRDKLNDELNSQRTELERSRLTPPTKTDFVELLKGRIAAKENFFLGRKVKEVELAEAK